LILENFFEKKYFRNVFVKLETKMKIIINFHKPIGYLVSNSMEKIEFVID
jgi:hypothetical protein